MAMLRRLHALGTKSGSDPASQLLRSLSSRSSTNSSGVPCKASNAEENSAVQAKRNSSLGAIGPARGVSRPFNSPNRGLSGLAWTGSWSGGDAIGDGRSTGLRSLTGGADAAPGR